MIGFPMSFPVRFVGTGYWVDRLADQFHGIEVSAQHFFTDVLIGILRDESHPVLEYVFSGKHYTALLVCIASGAFPR